MIAETLPQRRPKPDHAREATGAFEAATSTVTWTITATPETATTDYLVVDGARMLTNQGTRSAPLGDLAVNLEAKGKGSKWTTRASDVANATNGDAATTALVVVKASSEGRSSFSESAASGSLPLVIGG